MIQKNWSLPSSRLLPIPKVGNGNIRKVQKLSRHADPRTLMIYDDNRNKDLWEMSELLTGMLKDAE